MWATHRTLIFAAWHTLPIVRRSRFGFSDEVWLYSLGTGVWRSLVARFVRDEEAVGSNPATPTGNRRDRLVPAIFYRSALLELTTRCGVAPQISGREACLISDTCTPRPLVGRHPRLELRSARRLVVRPGSAGHAAASNRAGVKSCGVV